MRRALLLAAALLVAGSPAAAQSRDRLLRTAIHRLAREQNGSVFGPWAYAQGDLDGDGVRDRLALFTIEGMGGGNNYSFYLAVQLSTSRWRPITEGIGGKLNRSPQSVRVQGRTIVVPMREWTDTDGGCCPTREAVARFRLSGGRIVEVDR